MLWRHNNNISLVLKLLTDYLYAKNSYDSMPLFTKPREHASFGVAVYADLNDFLIQIKQNSIQHSSLPFHILYEHKKVLHLLVEYLIKIDCIADSQSMLNDFSLLVEKTIVLRNLYLKFEISEDHSLINKMRESLESIQALEASALESLIDLIEMICKRDFSIV
ncbi:hypothetical protein SAMN04487969_13316 [Paenibacillus algorifonticola]|uniref:Uncharacterized protein n=1 Tax=Paenibacillus algorifonticola TaxID=684063 RepID=A0A1I2IEK9_9BACL|nr:hypothetical protein SAMN04487969_13316 [Paenibacillus algorifonticola]